jgi:hypothetical protein
VLFYWAGSCLLNNSSFLFAPQEVLLRVPMHKIGWVMHYTEHTGQQIVAIEAGVSGSSNFKYYIYQAASEVRSAAWERRARGCECACGHMHMRARVCE